MKLKQYWIIDDDPIARVLIEKKMKREKLGEEFQAFSNGQAALDHLLNLNGETKPDLILLDLNMPILDGWEFLNEGQHKIEESEIKVAILTSSISNEDRDKANGYKCVSCFLKKPLDTEELLENLNSDL